MSPEKGGMFLEKSIPNLPLYWRAGAALVIAGGLYVARRILSMDTSKQWQPGQPDGWAPLFSEAELYPVPESLCTEQRPQD